MLGAVLWILVLLEWQGRKPSSPRETTDIVSVALEVATRLGEWIGTGAGLVAGILIGLCLLGTALSGALALIIVIGLLALRAVRFIWSRGGNVEDLANDRAGSWDRLFLPRLVSWDPETGEFTRVDGPKGFATWQEAEEAGRFLHLTLV